MSRIFLIAALAIGLSSAAIAPPATKAPPSGRDIVKNFAKSH
jgi:hypothetical protein